ncbi:TRAP transporter-DctM subunit [Dinoroseobacter shibae DFL 12 = DSM 16493]|uniref:TRAP transporter large permease protein n=1 Tax=Dinoroseobacter shibae (strain DSM 16493 / NCIMB 14021 / DFL 12) TaxID=398580 RepID=A8LLY3_DINSH|nr:TRAP transporter large permease [Dinoroseobacter shibae]ABV94892.1 TRAP transporter-DctM subunit [Dinoroseobacter shibae DFL 12 = DSM 16493]URF46313.1 TRAP transporter large permease [Dinoroseobacter shibae]URF50619.1 TRAP transporter large permease [Dinoroseobacter shibae]
MAGFWSVFLGGLLAFAGSGLALGAALGLTGLLILHFVANGATFVAVDAVWNVLNSFTLSAIPLFIILGEIMLRSGVSARIYSALSPVFMRVPGGLLHTNVAVCTLFGAVSGSSLSTAAAVGSVAYPEMTRRGYDRRTVVGSLAGGGTLGLLIPPSLSLLIFGALTETSIGQLFLAGLVPGLLFAAMFMVYIYLRCRITPSLAPAEAARPPGREILRGVLGLWPFLLLILSIMGSITLGFATPTEAAGIGVIATIIIGRLWGTLTLRALAEAVYAAIRLYGAIAFVVIGATILAQAVSLLGVPQAILETVRASDLGPLAVLAVVVLVYLVLGCFFDGLSLMIMTLPIVFPLLTGLGYDAIWLGVIITILIEIGQVTPPVGLNLSVLVSVTKNAVSLGEAAKATVPYWLILLAGVAILTALPALALFLPGALM